jgi:hypothetical protein
MKKSGVCLHAWMFVFGCVCSQFQLLNQLTDFHETSYIRYAIRYVLVLLCICFASRVLIHILKRGIVFIYL